MHEISEHLKKLIDMWSINPITLISLFWFKWCPVQSVRTWLINRGYRVVFSRGRTCYVFILHQVSLAYLLVGLGQESPFIGPGFGWLKLYFDMNFPENESKTCIRLLNKHWTCKTWLLNKLTQIREPNISKTKIVSTII